MDKCDTCKHRPTMSYDSSPCNQCVSGNLYCGVACHMVNPNIAFKDRYKRPSRHKYAKHIYFKGGSHDVHFSCQECGHETTTTFYKGMTLHTDSLRCPSCMRTNMNYRID